MNSLQDIEKQINKELPKKLKGFYHSGNELIPIEQIISNWLQMKELYESGEFDELIVTPDDGIKAYWWNPFWIPITDDGAGNFYCIDLDPDEGGNYGQVISFWHDSDERTLISESIDDWLDF